MSRSIIIIVTLHFIISSTDLFSQNKSLSPFASIEEESRNCMDRYTYELLLKRDPATGLVPENIRAMELQFSSLQRNAMLRKTSGSQIINWECRGPAQIAGRTAALGIDINNEAIILSGSTTGGMWRSIDSGATWNRTTSINEMPSVTCLAQDKRKGKTNTWYYGTGEAGGNTGAYPLWLNYGPYKWGDYYGNGIYKSTDNGISWKVLKSTTNDTVGSMIQPFSFVHNIAVDVSDTLKSIVYAAVSGGIQRSEDGGITWTMVLGSFPSGSIHTDVAVASDGTVYAILASAGNGWLPSPHEGIYRSGDGIHWTKISQTGWIGYYFVQIAIAPSNEKVVYITFNNTDAMASLLKYTYISGDGTGVGGILEDRSANLRASAIGYESCLAIKPDDENTIFIGGVQLYRSTDGFATATKTTMITPPHVDQQKLVFYPSNPLIMISGNDGGIHKTMNNLGPSNWISLNNNYITTQFYTVAIDHYGSRDSTLVGGMQDNGTYGVNSSNRFASWNHLGGGDGASCAISNNKTSYYVSSQWGVTNRRVLDVGGSIIASCRIDPVGSSAHLFINPFILDPTNSDIMYFGGGSFLWRNDSLPAIPFGNSLPTNIRWKKLNNTTVSDAGTRVTALISAIAASRTPANRVYYGTTDGQLYRLDNAKGFDPVPVNIWSGKGFPADAFVSAIAIDPKNADKVLVGFANYNIQSIFYSSNGGLTWIPIGGNLEEFHDGKGNGPGVRTLSILHTGNSIIYLAGTTTGLYSTESLNGMSTIWTLEGPDTIGHSIINMIDTRSSDGLVAVATCGHGIFTGNYLPDATGIQNRISELNLIKVFPNPTNGVIRIEEIDKRIYSVSVINVHGKVLNHIQINNEDSLTLDLSGYPSGIFFLEFESSDGTLMKKVVSLKR